MKQSAVPWALKPTDKLRGESRGPTTRCSCRREMDPGFRDCQEIAGCLDVCVLRDGASRLLRMRSFLNSIKVLPHAEKRPKGASRSTHRLAAAHLLVRQSISCQPLSPGKRPILSVATKPPCFLLGAHRATRQSPCRSMRGRGDCFAALAVTPLFSSARHHLGDGTAGRGAAAIDDILCAGDCGGEVGSEEQDGVGDLLGHDVAAERDR